MYQILSQEHIEKNRNESFKKLEKGNLFDLGRERLFILDEKKGKTLIVIELTNTNIEMILIGKLPLRTELNINDLNCININV